MYNNISKLNKNKCTGCRMCEQLCPVNAIDMVENKEGFIEPRLNESKCINCGVCAKRCPQLNDINFYNDHLSNEEVYAAKNKNRDEQLVSSSGGIFSVIANYVLENNGVVYGATFNDKMEVEHIGINNKNDIEKLRQSKYVQSNTRNTFKEVKTNLNNAKLVLYTGTPCQIAGLKSFLENEYDNLITVDIVCHGVPSPKLFKKYIKWLEDKNKSKIKKYEFRNKQKFEWGGLRGKNTLDPYYKTFLNALNYREVCYNCKYANEKRISDITIADYWGVNKEHPEFFDEKGVSAVFINSNKGKKYFEKVKENIVTIETTKDKVSKQNLNLKKPSERKEIRDKIYKDIDEMSFEEYMNTRLCFKKELKDIVKSKIPPVIKKKIKKILKI